MAYRTRYVYSFDSPEGKEIEITIADNAYSGNAKSRPLGGAPTLRMDSSGCVRGMSLEIPAECQVADEYADLYTSDPTRFKVTLSVNEADVWFGFISPEIYAAPWVDPPYDVSLTATDGLGELKRHDYEARGRQSLSGHLTFLLAKTGLSLPVRLVSRLESDITARAYFLDETEVSLDHMAGKTCYDVLQAILTGIHATIRQQGGRWLIIRETDVSDSMINPETVADTSGASYPIVPFGSMRSEPVWPVGRLTSEIVPARKATVIECANESSGNLLPDGDMSAGTWSGTGTHDSDNDWYRLYAGEYIYRNADLPYMVSGSSAPDLTLEIKARQTDAAARHKAWVRVKAYGQRINASTMATYYLADDSIDSPGELYWSDTEKHLTRELKEATTADVYDTLRTDVPFAALKSNYLGTISYLEIRVEAEDGTVIVKSADLNSLTPYDGVRTVVSMGNGARGADSAVDVEFADTYGYNMGLSWASNALWANHQSVLLIEEFSSDRITSCRTGQFIGQDYALSVALPRLAVKGVLHLPADTLPPVFASNDGIDFIVDEFSYDLKEDEVDISMVSLPAATITVVSIEQTRTVSGGGGSSSGSGSGGSGGGGGGGATTLAALTDVDLATAPPVNGQALTYNGTTGLWVPGAAGSGSRNVFYGTCPTALATPVKVVTATGFGASDLTEGTVLHILFANSNSDPQPMLDVNGTGVHYVWHNQTPQYMWSNNTIASFVFENDGWRLFGNYAYTNRYGKVMLVTTIAGLIANKATQNRLAITPNLAYSLYVKTLAAPSVKIVRGYNVQQHATEYIVASHPMATYSTGFTGSFVLMYFCKRRRRRVSPRYSTARLAKIKEGWGEARGELATDTPLTWAAGHFLYLDTLREAVVKKYVFDGESRVTSLAGFYNGNDPAFGIYHPASHRGNKKRTRLFGIAWRTLNPEYVAPEGETETTRVDLNGNPKYIYSGVTPLKAFINETNDGRVMGFRVMSG